MSAVFDESRQETLEALSSLYESANKLQYDIVIKNGGLNPHVSGVLHAKVDEFKRLIEHFVPLYRSERKETNDTD